MTRVSEILGGHWHQQRAQQEDRSPFQETEGERLKAFVSAIYDKGGHLRPENEANFLREMTREALARFGEPAKEGLEMDYYGIALVMEKAGLTRREVNQLATDTLERVRERDHDMERDR